jgi:hypothetical protein
MVKMLAEILLPPCHEKRPPSSLSRRFLHVYVLPGPIQIRPKYPCLLRGRRREVSFGYGFMNQKGVEAGLFLSLCDSVQPQPCDGSRATWEGLAHIRLIPGNNRALPFWPFSFRCCLGRLQS